MLAIREIIKFIIYRMHIKLLLFLFYINSIFCANILFMCPAASPSHHIWNKILALELTSRRHNVTMITHEIEYSTQKNFTVITMEGMYEAVEDHVDLGEMSKGTPFNTIKMFYDIGLFTAEFDYRTQGLKTLLDYPANSFDLIKCDITMGRSMLAVVEKFNKAPVVGVIPFLLPPNAAMTFGSPIFTSYMPFFCKQYSDLVFAPREEAIMKKAFPNSRITLAEASRKMSLLLANTDPMLEYPLPLPPNVIPVGGLHAKSSQPLPKDFEKIMAGAKHGAIVFSLGTNIRSDELDQSAIDAFLKAFSKLPQVIFWKFESDDIVNIPKNVFVKKWLPQNDLLGHPNTVLFIGHGGALGTQEAIYHRVPIIGIPFVVDQHTNVRRVVAKNIALHLNKNELSFENIYKTLTKILNTTEYTKNVKILSAKFRSQPQTSLQRATFWIEHVIQYGGAEHLSVRARDLSILEIANFDVVLIVIIPLVALLLIIKSFSVKYKRLPTKKLKTG